MIVEDRETVEVVERVLERMDSGRAYPDYSGRGMFGQKCFGIVGGIGDLVTFMMELVKEEPDLAQEMASYIQHDSMGLDSIYYFPDVHFPNIDPPFQDEEY